MQMSIKRWPHNWVFFVVCTVYLAQGTEPYLLYSCFGTVLPDVPAFSANRSVLIDAFSRPGGLASAITGLLSLCFYSSWSGALVIVATALGMGELTRRHFKAAGFGSLPVLTCLPAIVVLLIYSRYTHPLLGMLVVCFGLLSAWLLLLPPHVNAKLAALLHGVTTVVTFWLGGTGALVVFVAMTLIHAAHGRKRSIALALGLPMGLAVIWILLQYVALIPVTQAWPITLPFSKAVTGGMKAFSKGLLIVLYSYTPACLAMVLMGRWAWHKLSHSHGQTRKKHKQAKDTESSRQRMLRLSQTVGMTALPLVILCLSLAYCHDPLSKPNVQMHYHSHHKQWAEVLEAADQLPKGQTSVVVHHAIVRALCHTDRLAFDLLKFPQTPQGLFLTHEESVSALTQLKLHDLYLELGQVNMAEKQVSELLAADVEFGAIYERLVWIHIIKEQYDTARIFTNALHKDPLHRKTAKALANILDDGVPEDQIERIERIRACMPRHTEIVQESLDLMLLQLLDHNPNNKMAFEYLMTLYCLSGQVNKVAEWLPHTTRFSYPTTPPLYQEAAIIHFVAQKEIVDTKRVPIVPETLEQYKRFMQLRNAYQKSRQKALLSQLINEFGSSYFFYYSFGQVGIK